MKNLKVYYIEFDSLQLGGDALVVAGDELDAQIFLEDKLREMSGSKEIEIRKVEEIDIKNERVKLLNTIYGIN